MEWASELPPPAFAGETWVDYANAGFSGSGTFDLPFGSLGEAVAFAPFYRRILIKSGPAAKPSRSAECPAGSPLWPGDYLGADRQHLRLKVSLRLHRAVLTVLLMGGLSIPPPRRVRDRAPCLCGPKFHHMNTCSLSRGL